LEEARRQEVLAEIEDWRAKNKKTDRPWQSELANFHLLLPDPESSSGSFMTDQYESMGFLDRPHGEFITNPEERSLHSELFLGQTPRELFQTIDNVIKDISSVSLVEILKLVREERAYGNTLNESSTSFVEMDDNHELELEAAFERSIIKLNELNMYVMPIYIVLRVKGYTHYDLTS